MPLKDLIADSSKLDEGSIERIVADFIRYDPKAGRIIFTPSGISLSNENKILVYLTAIAGWRFVSDTPPDISTKPADLEAPLGIAGGSLRPALKKLKDVHLLSNDAGHYTIQSANLSHIEAYVKGETRPTRRKSNAKRSSSADVNQEPSRKGENRRTKKQKGGGSAASAFDDLLHRGFFNSPKTLKQLQEKLEERGLIFPQTALSGLVLNAVRSEALKREKTDSNGRKVWAYSSDG